jgi:diacylglycerol kinase (ATP)
LRAAGAAVDVQRTADEDAFAAVCRAAAGRRVVLLGGDGTVHAAANLGVGGVDFALVPGGMANNVARALGVPRDVDRAAQVAVTGTARPLDTIEASSATRRRHVVEGLSIGLHAVARQHYRGANSDALLDGLRSAAIGLREFAGARVDLRLDGGAAERVDLGQVFVANLPYFAFGLRVAPQAIPDDGAFDVVALPPAARRAVPLQVARLARGRHLGRPGVRTWRARSAELQPHGSPVVADTADLGPGAIRLEARSGTLRVVRP